MKAPGRTGARLAGLFLLGCLLFNYPLLALFDRPVLVGGVPIIYAYLFTAWLVVIVATALVVELTD